METIWVILHSSSHTDSQTANTRHTNKKQLNSEEPALTQGCRYVLLDLQRASQEAWHTGQEGLAFSACSEDKSQDTDVRLNSSRSRACK